MKKLLSLLAIFCATAAVAQNVKGQFSLKPMAGVNLSTFAGGTDDLYKLKTGFTAGAEAEYGITDNLGLSLGLVYSKQGARIDGDITLMGNDDQGNQYISVVSMDGKLIADYLNVPLLANIYIPAIKGLSLRAGVQMGLLVNDKMDAYEEVAMMPIRSADVTLQTGVPSLTLMSVKATDVCKSLDFGIPVGLAYEYKGVNLNVSYYFGLTKLDNTEDPDNERNRCLSITLGYRFHL